MTGKGIRERFFDTSWIFELGLKGYCPPNRFGWKIEDWKFSRFLSKKVEGLLIIWYFVKGGAN